MRISYNHVFILSIITLAVAYPYNTALGDYSARFSAVAYCPENQVASWNCYWCTQIPDFILLDTFWEASTSTYAYLGYDPGKDHFVLAFEGTQDIEDWIIDLQIATLSPYKEYPDARVHTGFWKAYTSIRQPLFDALGRFRVQTLFVTGHSLGNALATVASLDIAEELNMSSITMVGLAGPRVGNPAYAELFQTLISDYYRITHSNDPIPHLPPMFLGFMHIGHEVYYPNNTLAYVYCSEPEDVNCIDSHMGWNATDHRYYMDMWISYCEPK
jgi:hypothetical protein